MHNRCNVLGIKFDNLSLQECLSVVEGFIEQGTFHYFATPDMYRALKAVQNEDIRNIYSAADITLSDGTALVLASRILGAPLKTRVRCPDLTDSLLELSMRKGYRVFVVRGGEPDVTEIAIAGIQRKYPTVNIIDTYTVPYNFNPRTHLAVNAELMSAILDKRPHILLFALGYPNEEKWLWQEKERLHDIPVCLGVGGALESYAGRAKRAPRWMCNSGLEWLFRVIQEPGRLWKRYAVGGPTLAFLILKELLFTRLSKRRKYAKTGS